jgi:hypothetical protein
MAPSTGSPPPKPADTISRETNIHPTITLVAINTFHSLSFVPLYVYIINNQQTKRVDGFAHGHRINEPRSAQSSPPPHCLLSSSSPVQPPEKNKSFKKKRKEKKKATTHFTFSLK